MAHDGSAGRRSILLTGGAGRIATGFASHASDRYEFTLLDLPGQFDRHHNDLGRLIEADFTDIDSLAGAFDGMDTVVHLGGERRPGATWAQLLPMNIVGTYNVVAAALAAGCRRMVYASSVHAVSGHAWLDEVRETDPVYPSDLYGVTKCFGEALGAYASQEGLSFAALRIGAFENAERLRDPGTGWILRDYCAPEDLYALLAAVIEMDALTFEVYNAVSKNRYARLPTTKAEQELGYHSTIDSFHLASWYQDEPVTSEEFRDKIFESGMREDLARIRGRGAS